ncbi:hypothetical protein [Enterococcus sp. LJL51]|uniref:hypothetical protein n=1 Tax=Enterococcus sp. LJL51 TaxID=3416656 RepID=UPI003CE6BA28
MYKNEFNDIMCPFCGEYGLIEVFRSKMNNEPIYRCYECLGIYESLADLEYTIQAEEGSGYAKMIGVDVKNFERDTIKIGRLTTKDLESYVIEYKEYTNLKDINYFAKGYFDGKLIIKGGARE